MIIAVLILMRYNKYLSFRSWLMVNRSSTVPHLFEKGYNIQSNYQIPELISSYLSKQEPKNKLGK